MVVLRRAKPTLESPTTSPIKYFEFFINDLVLKEMGPQPVGVLVSILENINLLWSQKEGIVRIKIF